MDAKVKLEQARMRRGWCAEDLARHDEDIARFEKELAEAEKPELRHWDLTVDRSGRNHIVIRDMGGNLEVAGSTFLCTTGVQLYHTKIGNLEEVFDDLTALQEDVEEFKTVSPAAKETTYRIDGDGDLLIDLNGNPQQTVVQKSDLAELVLKLRQMAATAKRKD